MSAVIPIAIVGVGYIARDAHIPAISGDSRFELVACVTRHEPPSGVQAYPTIELLLSERPDVAAISFCSPPQGRHAIARKALDAGKNVMLEKPPGVTVSEIDDLTEAAIANQVALFATWHTRAAPAVEPARKWLADKRITRVAINWKEDVRRWHSGQQWIWEPGGFGVFDPGINALSAITTMHPQQIFVTAADLEFPSNRATPIGVRLSLTDARGTPISAEFDWRKTGDQIWEIEVETDSGNLLLSAAGAKLSINGVEIVHEENAEYPSLYRRFATLVDNSELDVDMAPFRLVADAMMIANRKEVAAFLD